MRTQKWCEIGARLIQIRGKRSIADFADEMGVHKNTLGRYERGLSSVNGDFIQDLVEQGFNANWILTGEGPMLLKELDEQRFDVETLQQAVRVLETRLKVVGNTMTAERKADAIAHIYQLLIDEGGDEKGRADLILRLLSLDQ